MKVRIKLGFRYDAEEVAESECKTKEEFEEFARKHTKSLWNEVKSDIDFYVMDNSDNSRLSDMYFEYEILEADE